MWRLAKSDECSGQSSLYLPGPSCQPQRKLFSPNWWSDKASIPQELVKPVPSAKEAISHITGRKDKWPSVVTIRVPKCTVVSSPPQCHKYLLDISESILAPWLSSPPPSLHFCSSWASLSTAIHSAIPALLSVCLSSPLLPSLSLHLSLLSPPLLSLPVPACVYTQSTTFPLCSELFPTSLEVLSFVPTVKHFI